MKINEMITHYSLAEGRASEQVRISAHEGFPLSRVLVVEDNPVNQKLFQRLLEKFGCQVDMAANGLEALDLWSSRQYDVVFMDCQMPKWTGSRQRSKFDGARGAGAGAHPSLR